MSENNDFQQDNITTGTETPSSPPVKSAAREVGEWVLSIVIALVIALVLRNYVISFVRVDGSSMVPTLQNNERLFIVRLGYKPKSGDIIILDPGPGADGKKRGPYVKRVIGLPGETVEINNETGEVTVDSKPFVVDGINNETRSAQDTYVVPENSVFVMGDNRNNSHDSRASDVSFVPYNRVMGKVVFRVWPLNKLRKF
ncbi:MAG: signal peptidase I [Clostridia bacterium]|nr:signal peptidase I [Clostridia bacterium]